MTVDRFPAAEEIIALLRKVKDDSRIEGFYPVAAKHLGGKHVHAASLVAMLTAALHEYGAAQNSVGQLFPQFIDALVDDPQIRQEAKAFLKGGRTVNAP